MLNACRAGGAIQQEHPLTHTMSGPYCLIERKALLGFPLFSELLTLCLFAWPPSNQGGEGFTTAAADGTG
jgi:hypothetical protein